MSESRKKITYKKDIIDALEDVYPNKYSREQIEDFIDCALSYIIYQTDDTTDDGVLGIRIPYIGIMYRNYYLTKNLLKRKNLSDEKRGGLENVMRKMEYYSDFKLNNSSTFLNKTFPRSFRYKHYFNNKFKITDSNYLTTKYNSNALVAAEVWQNEYLKNKK